MILSSCHALDFGMLHIIILFCCWLADLNKKDSDNSGHIIISVCLDIWLHACIYDDSRQECMMTCTVDIHYR